MKKLLIFTLSTGGGHNEAASNLKKEFVKQGYSVTVVDFLHELNKVIDSIVTHSFNIVSGRFPKLFGKIYDLSNREKFYKIFNDTTTDYISEKILSRIQQVKPDLVISTHALLVGTIGYLKSEGLIDIPYMAVVTDYEAHLSYVNRHVDAYIAASDYTRSTLIKRGVKGSVIYPYGIPIKDEFFEEEDSKLEDEDPVFQILLMAGSLGLKGMAGVLENIVGICRPIRIIAVCGHNKKLKKTIEKEFSEQINRGMITVYDFTNMIPALMEESDLLITKPGGLTITEAIAKGLPMVIPYFIPGQEKENLDYLLSEGIAFQVEDPDQINAVLEQLMDHPEILEGIRKKMSLMFNKSCTDNIVDLGDHLIEQYSQNI